MQAIWETIFSKNFGLNLLKYIGTKSIESKLFMYVCIGLALEMSDHEHLMETALLIKH